MRSVVPGSGFERRGQQTSEPYSPSRPPWVRPRRPYLARGTSEPLRQPPRFAAGPRVRSGETLARYKADLEDRPPAQWPRSDPGFLELGYPEARFAEEESTPAEVEKINSKHEARGMRYNWYLAPNGPLTVVRILPKDLCDLVMHSDTPL